MSQVRMEALVRLRYGGRWFYPGEPVTVANDTDADDMVALNLAKRSGKVAAAPAPSPAPAVATADLEASVPASIAEDTEQKVQESAKGHRHDARPAGKYTHREVRGTGRR